MVLLAKRCGKRRCWDLRHAASYDVMLGLYASQAPLVFCMHWGLLAAAVMNASLIMMLLKGCFQLGTWARLHLFFLFVLHANHWMYLSLVR